MIHKISFADVKKLQQWMRCIVESAEIEPMSFLILPSFSTHIDVNKTAKYNNGLFSIVSTSLNCFDTVGAQRRCSHKKALHI